MLPKNKLTIFFSFSKHGSQYHLAHSHQTSRRKGDLENRHGDFTGQDCKGLCDFPSHSIGWNIIRSAHQTSRSYTGNITRCGHQLEKRAWWGVSHPCHTSCQSRTNAQLLVSVLQAHKVHSRRRLDTAAPFAWTSAWLVSSHPSDLSSDVTSSKRAFLATQSKAACTQQSLSIVPRFNCIASASKSIWLFLLLPSVSLFY